MADRVKMSRSDRAKQFAPFDALKGLHEAIKLKEFEHEMIAKNEMSEDEIKIISNELSKIEKGDKVKVKFFRDGHMVDLEGASQINVIEQSIKVGAFIVFFDDIKEIKILEKSQKNQ